MKTIISPAKNWRDTLRLLVEDIIRTIDHDRVNADGYDFDSEKDLDFSFPALESYVVPIDGKFHKIEILVTIDDELPYALQFTDDYKNSNGFKGTLPELLELAKIGGELEN